MEKLLTLADDSQPFAYCTTTGNWLVAGGADRKRARNRGSGAEKTTSTLRTRRRRRAYYNRTVTLQLLRWPWHREQPLDQLPLSHSP